MRVLMLGWEFPPFISGGLGTACYGLTKALARYGTQVAFVLPRPIVSHHTSHVRLLFPQPVPMTPDQAEAHEQILATSDVADVSTTPPASMPSIPTAIRRRWVGVTYKQVPGWLVSPYQSAGGRFHPEISTTETTTETSIDSSGQPRIGFIGPTGISQHPDLVVPADRPAADPYAGDMMKEIQRYARLCLALAAGERFDVIHAHDWMTYPAGLAVAAATGKPLVIHVHSTEFDRSGQNVNQPVYDIERRGMLGALRIIAVSHLTKSILVHRYGVDPAKVDVVYNGIDNGHELPSSPRAAIKKGDKLVLFLGRITWQKGPEFFIRAARKVLEKYDRVKFVMAGSGDKISEIIELAAAYGIGHKIVFTGFLHGRDVERIFKMADVYVMPSVSEPFGIAPLEAISHDVPVIISKSSGVAEVLTHALKVDFWDIDEIANKIIAVLKHPPLSSTLREHADMELRRLTWDDAAQKCVATYQSALNIMP